MENINNNVWIINNRGETPDKLKDVYIRDICIIIQHPAKIVNK